MTDNTPIKPEDIKVGQTVTAKWRSRSVEMSATFTIAAIASNYAYASSGVGFYTIDKDWTLIEDVPDPDAELIERLARERHGIGWETVSKPLREAYLQNVLTTITSIRETHDITPRSYT